MEIKKFTRKKELDFIEFEVDGEMFKAVTVAPAMAILDVAQVNKLEDVERVKVIMAFLDQVLEPESAARFAERLKSAINPVTLEETAEVAVWLVEEVYATERPSEAPSPSPGGSETTGPNTTATASTNGAQESTLESSTPVVP